MARYAYLQADGGGWRRGSHALVGEATLSLTLNGRSILAAVVSPHDLEAFVIGFLFTEEIVRGLDEIESIKWDGNVVSVLTKNPFRAGGGKKIVLSGCGGTTSHLDTKRLPKLTSPLTVPLPRIAESMEQLRTAMPEPVVGGIHAAALAGGEGPLLVSSDIGLHNALDKAIGLALQAKRDLSRMFALSSDRISSELVRKCLVANISLVASRGSPTTLAVDLAERTGLCTIGFVEGGRLNIYTHPERLEGIPAVP